MRLLHPYDTDRERQGRGRSDPSVTGSKSKSHRPAPSRFRLVDPILLCSALSNPLYFDALPSG